MSRLMSQMDPLACSLTHLPLMSGSFTEASEPLIGNADEKSKVTCYHSILCLTTLFLEDISLLKQLIARYSTL